MGHGTSAKGRKLHCHAFDYLVGVQDAQCPRPDHYCEHREWCGLYFMMIEREDSKKRKLQEDKDAFV